MTNTSLVWNKSRNRYWPIVDNEGSDKKKLLFVLMKQQEESEVEERALKSKGVCPHCFCYRPMSGICDCER